VLLKDAVLWDGVHADTVVRSGKFVAAAAGMSRALAEVM
jgi:hypothetical protein